MGTLSSTRVADICNRDVVQCDRDADLFEIARLMRNHHVGSVVVTARSGGATRPVGIITDRDIVVALVATGTPLEAVAAGDVCRTNLATVVEDAGFQEAIDVMRVEAVKRLPVVDAAGTLAGIVSADDIIAHLGTCLFDLSCLSSMEAADETQRRARVPAAGTTAP